MTTADTLCRGGLTWREVTFTLPGTAGLIGRLKAESGTDASIGAGTLMLGARLTAATVTSKESR